MPSPSGTTPIFGFPYLLETDVPDIATASEDLALGIEAIIATAFKGTFAGRPAAGKFGRWYYATDTGGLFLDNGTIWLSPLSGNPCAHMTTTASSSIPNGVLTGVGGFSGGLDFAKGGFTQSSNTLLVPVAGYYEVRGCVQWGTGVPTATVMTAQLTVGFGSPIGEIDELFAPSASGSSIFVLKPTAFQHFNAGDAIGLETEQNSGGTLSCNQGPPGGRIWVKLVSQ